MPIYSTNRVSGASTSIVAAEGYTEHDFGRILSECATNDMKLFNAAIARDFQEITAMQEGTMVSSEVRALQEFSIKEAWKGIVEKLKKLWAKIKGVFRNVYAKLSLWLNRSNKLYVAQNRKYLQNKNLTDCPLPKYLKPKGDYYNKIDKAIKELGDYTKLINDLRTADNPSLKDIIKAMNIKMLKNLDIQSFVGKKEFDKNINADEMYEGMLKAYFSAENEKLTWGNSGMSLDTLFTNLSGSSKKLKDLKKASKTIDGAFKKIISDINKMADSDSEKEVNKKKYRLASDAATTFQTCINAATSAFIKLTKKAISNDRGLIAALVAYDPKKPKNENAIMCEFAYATGFDTLHEETDDMTPEDVDDAAESEGITVDINVSVDGDAEVGDVNVDGDDD